MTTELIVPIVMKKATTAEWGATSYIPLAGELCVEVTIDKPKIKIGDGSSSWAALPYVSSDFSSISAVIEDIIAADSNDRYDLLNSLIESIRTGSAVLVTDESGNIAVEVPVPDVVITNAQLFAGGNDDKSFRPSAFFSPTKPVTLTYASTVNVDVETSAALVFVIDLTGSITLNFVEPTNTDLDGCVVRLKLINSGGGSGKTVTLNTAGTGGYMTGHNLDNITETNVGSTDGDVLYITMIYEDGEFIVWSREAYTQ